jgi:tungstate transport system substrate-binding protein
MRPSASAFALAAGLSFLAGRASAAGEALTLATTTSTENSGLLGYLHPDFEKQTGIRVRVIAKGTGASLQLARDGNADVVLAHAPEEEARFMAEGHGAERREVMYNDFVILGPAEDPAGLRGLKDAAAALAKLAEARRPFLSRGDRSGTHVKEMELWRASGVKLNAQQQEITGEGGQRTVVETLRPGGEWYLSIGQGMGRTLLMATEKRAYTLSDRGTYLSLRAGEKPRTDLAILCEGDRRLRNTYSVIAVNPEKHPQVQREAAARYVRWITSPEVQRKIGEYRVEGQVLFHPLVEREEK